MKTVAVFCVFLAVCYAQTPPKKPDIPETFVAKNITIYAGGGGHEQMSQGYIERSFDKKVGKQDSAIKFKIPNDTHEERNIARLDTRMSYFIRTESSGNITCQKTKIPDGVEMEPVWSWLNSKEIHGDRCKDPRTGNMYDCWSLKNETEKTIIMLYVDDANLKVPIALIFKSTVEGVEQDTRFNEFEGTEPPKADFEPPASCK